MRRIPLLLILFAALGVVAAGPRVASAQPDMYLELMGALKAPIPGDCSTWHELYPVYCRTHHQDRYIHTDPSGQMAVCDYILLSGVWYHIEWVGPTYKVTFLDQGALADFEPTMPTTGENPVCETWMEVHPDFGAQYHIDGWNDNGDGVISACDVVIIGGRPAHIDDIRVNIRVVPGDPVPIDDQTWGDVKKQY